MSEMPKTEPIIPDLLTATTNESITDYYKKVEYLIPGSLKSQICTGIKEYGIRSGLRLEFCTVGGFVEYYQINNSTKNTAVLAFVKKIEEVLNFE